MIKIRCVCYKAESTVSNSNEQNTWILEDFMSGRKEGLVKICKLGCTLTDIYVTDIDCKILQSNSSLLAISIRLNK